MRIRLGLIGMGLVALSGCASCQGSMGTLTNPRKELRELVNERPWVWYVSTTGTNRIRLDGTEQEQFLRPGYYIADVSVDGGVFVVGDSNTNLYVIQEPERELKPVPEPALLGRASEVALHPDGTTFAAARHADFNTPQSTWSETEDDRIFVVDTETLAARSVSPSMKAEVLTVAWSTDGGALWLRTETATQRIDPVTGERSTGMEWPTDGLVPPWRARSNTCPTTGDVLVERGDGADQGLEIQSPTNATRALITVEGRERGFHDYDPTIDNFFFTSSCRYVVFQHDRDIYVVEVESGDLARLAEGSEPFMLSRN